MHLLYRSNSTDRESIQQKEEVGNLPKEVKKLFSTGFLAIPHREPIACVLPPLAEIAKSRMNGATELLSNETHR